MRYTTLIDGVCVSNYSVSAYTRLELLIAMKQCRTEAVRVELNLQTF